MQIDFAAMEMRKAENGWIMTYVAVGDEQGTVHTLVFADVYQMLAWIKRSVVRPATPTTEAGDAA